MCYKNKELLGFEAKQFFCSLYHAFTLQDYKILPIFVPDIS
jgi:hypothetical protein